VFNPALKHNDGLLAEAYMQDHNTNFKDAQNLLKSDVDELKDNIRNLGRVTLEKIGTFRKGSNPNELFFRPAANLSSFSVHVYGLGAVNLPPLAFVEATATPAARKTGKNPAIVDVNREQHSRFSSVGRMLLRLAAIVVVAVTISLLNSLPVKNSAHAPYVAGFLPEFVVTPEEEMQLRATTPPPPNQSGDNKAVKAIQPPPVNMVKGPTTNAEEVQSTATSPATTGTTLTGTAPAATSTTATTAQPANSTVATTTTGTSTALPTAAPETTEATTTTPNRTPETIASQSTSRGVQASDDEENAKAFYVIVGSFRSQTLAEGFLETAKKYGCPNAGILQQGPNYRIFSDTYDKRIDAERNMRRLLSEGNFKSAWLFVEQE
jgi:cell division septation protein DedD